MAVGFPAGTVLAVNLEFVTVGNPGNAPDTHPSAPFGAVAYVYRIGKFEVTAGQYCDFLNAVAKIDTYGLYNTKMADPASAYVWGCNIQRSLGPGGYTYSVASDWANRPVNFVSWGDAARFCNWLTNGQPTGAQGLSTTEDGSYYLNGATDWTLADIPRKPNARFVIPSEDEWYKAAYHKNDGVTGNYWTFPTGTDSVPSNQLVNPDPGNNANYWDYYGTGTYSIGSPYYRTEAGEFANSDSPYGTFDQGGNVWEWNEARVYSDITFNWDRGQRGGSAWSVMARLLAASVEPGDIHDAPTSEAFYAGFRVVEVPEPASAVLMAVFLALVGARSRRSCAEGLFRELADGNSVLG